LLATGINLLPTLLSQIALDGFADQLARLAVLFLGRSLYLGQQARGDKGIGAVSDFMHSKIASPPEEFKEAMFSRR
jgi:hypothetical protein